MFFWAIPAVIILIIIVYVKAKKLYPLMYALSIFSYINLVIYIISAFNLKKNGIIIILILSAGLMIGLGLYIAHGRKEA